jgi:hypothetical protein
MPQIVQTLKSLSSEALLAVSQLCTIWSNLSGPRPGAPTENPEGRPWEVINLLFPSLQSLPSGGDEKTLRRLKEMLQRIML